MIISTPPLPSLAPPSFVPFQAYYGDRMPEYIHDRSSSSTNNDSDGGGADSGGGGNLARGAADFWRNRKEIS